MDSREKELAFLEAELVECQGRLHQELLAVGQAVSAASPAPPADTELARLLDDARVLQTRVEQARDLIAQVQTRAERVVAIESIVRGNDQRVKDAMREVEHRYRDIGELGAKVYREKCSDPGRFTDVFQPLAALEDDLGRLRQEITRLEQDGQKHGFFAKVMDKSKILLVEAKMRYREIDRAAALEEVGRRVCASKFPEAVTDQAFADLMGKIESNRKRAIDIQEETAQLRVEQARIEEELRTLGATTEPSGRIKDLEREVEAAAKQLQDAQRAVGTLLCTRDLAGQVPAVDLTLRLRTVHELREVEKAKAGRMERIRSSMDLDRVNEEMTRLHTQKAQLEVQIKEAQSKLATLEAEIERHRTRGEELRRQAGEAGSAAPGAPPSTAEAASPGSPPAGAPEPSESRRP